MEKNQASVGGEPMLAPIIGGEPVCAGGRVIDGRCFIPTSAWPCTVGQGQIAMQCVDITDHTIAMPVDACGFDLQLAAGLLIIKIIQCVK